jgi:integrase
MFGVFAAEYLASPIHGQKKQSTRASERVILEYWKKHLGAVRLDKITDVIVKSYREKRLAEGVTARTVNKETVAFYQVLKLANDRGLISSLPRVRQLKQKPPPKRPLLASEDVERLLRDCNAEVTKNADLLRFYLRFLILTGAREKEALCVRWADVDFEKGFLTIGADADTKNARDRTVNFTPELRSLLQDMIAARPPDSSVHPPSGGRAMS